ncbi:hemagglutinin repeat-containing protein [Caballeronia sp. LZ032]|nr:hemagglutinin repeat-containing protein [Caballeronia sp. LZ032]MDR5884281.1 hemagglutinin repeat-containing protein [Caballeronia sp. LZ032]
MRNPSIAVQLSVGSSSSRSDSSETQTIHRGSSVNAGGSAAFMATEGNLNIAGSNISASDVVLAAKDQVNVVNTTDTASTRSSSSTKSTSVGLSFGTNGFGISAAMANAHGDANSDAAIQNASHVTGANSVAIVSGGDTNVIGSQIAGRQIAADVGGNLNIASVQDMTVSAAHQSSAGGGFAISQSGGGGSFSSQHGNASGNYAAVEEQSGIHAGEGGFDITVKGSTDLKGAVIASDADASRNTLNTGTLTFSDLQNRSDYSASSSGFSAGGSIGTAQSGIGPSSVSGAGGVVPMMSQSESGSSNGITRSAISAGTINVTDREHQTQDVANLSRDTSSTNGTVSTLPDVNNLLDKQGDMMNAASAAGEAVATQIGMIANAKRDGALKDAKAAYERGDLDAMQGYLDTADSWSESGSNRIALHVAGGGLIGGLGGGGIGSAAQGAAGAGMSAYLANRTQQFADAVAEEAGSKLIGNIAGNVASTLGGGIIGGTAGAAAASNVNLYNQNNNRKESEAAKEAKELRQILDKERAMLAQKSVKTADTGAATVRPPTGALAGKDAKSTFWTSTKDKTPVENAYGHSTKHGGEFPEYQNSVQYVQSAQDFVNNPPDGTLIKTRPNGDTLFYDPATNTFASKNKDGAPRTMFRPSAGMDYWNKQ